ncbi:MAG: hypoxanthine-guanine phosphoribosyltransferase [Candidatus Competibacteraceae bacterium]|nr:hypoxanthine-guanine phosphoribosyltransferase [Candidatus Competibacteraceae bacterium]MCP5125556.1 hypoxanthine-guanine phosphoribosyltransferase [Gammaproteobacteria bacterium]HRX71594.1 hypoxanthine-guanine phosphoribosyltransferase [Candidatus Competibacteraceae bacterium]
MSSTITPEQALAVLRDAERLFSPEQVQSALDRLATQVTARLEQRDPLVLMVMNGAFIPTAQLLARLPFPLQVGYVHATRYRSGTRGGEIDWVAQPRPAVEGRVVLVVDDIFDEGDTLKAIVEEVRRQGAMETYSAVLVNKQHDRKVAGLTVDFIGLEIPDRYVFGCGMDYKEYWRQLPGIYAIRD